MATVTVSPKYQVVIPSALRRDLGIRPGQKIEVLGYEGRLEFVLVQPMSRLRGFLILQRCERLRGSAFHGDLENVELKTRPICVNTTRRWR